MMYRVLLEVQNQELERKLGLKGSIRLRNLWSNSV